jgi:hypothetical protein
VCDAAKPDISLKNELRGLVPRLLQPKHRKQPACAPSPPPLGMR